MVYGTHKTTDYLEFLITKMRKIKVTIYLVNAESEASNLM